MKPQLDGSGAVDPQHPANQRAHHEDAATSEEHDAGRRHRGVARRDLQNCAHQREDSAKERHSPHNRHGQGGETGCASRRNPAHDGNESESSIEAHLVQHRTQGKAHPDKANRYGKCVGEQD